MYKNFRYLFVACFSLLMFLVQTSCKKQDKFPGQTLPDIITVNPTSAIPGSPVTIKGNHLSGVTAVRFGTIAAVFNIASDTSISAIVPDSIAAGNLYVQVYVGDGVAYAAQKFTIVEAPKIPTIAKVAPDTAFPGDVITITGINFTAVSSVTFGSTSALYVIDDSTKLSVTVPDGLSDATQLITVSAPTGSDTASFTVNFAPVVLSFAPTQAQAGDVITVLGKRFGGATGVTLGTVTTTYNLVNDSTLTFTVPAGASSDKITVTTAKGSGTSNSSLTVLAAGLAFPIYDDAVTSNWNGYIGGGWGGDKNYDNTSPVESGTKSVKIDYVGGYGSPMQLGGGNIAIAPYTTFKISIYGAPGSGGKQINLGINQKDEYTITVVEGQWTDYQIPITNLGLTSTSFLTDIWLKEYSNVGGFTVYVDNMGLN